MLTSHIWPCISGFQIHGFTQPQIMQHCIYWEKNLLINGPLQFKVVLFKGQWYSERLPNSIKSPCNESILPVVFVVKISIMREKSTFDIMKIKINCLISCPQTGYTDKGHGKRLLKLLIQGKSKCIMFQVLY